MLYINSYSEKARKIRRINERPLSPCSNSSSSAASSIAFGRGSGPENFQLALRLPSGRRLANIRYSAERTPLQIISEVIPEANRATIAQDYTAFINEVPRRQLILDAPLWAQNQGGNFGSAKSAFSDRRRQFFRSAGIRSAEPSIFVGKIGKNRRVGKIGGSAESGKISQIRQANHNQFNDAT
ncbi:unnamed protein product [Oikopleura dioica]|uniref:Uncharacterized protein n=1 Tax=Oikopleura dioica TaxID=34765 RepID=E4YRI0_OIKDI|nr:unnamed protein product [Oikopleura dioica]